MNKLIIALAFTLSACGVGTEGESTVVSESHGQRSDGLNDLPFGLCIETCGTQPTIPPPGQTCTLTSDTCDNGIRTCVWDCQPTPPPAPTNWGSYSFPKPPARR